MNGLFQRMIVLVAVIYSAKAIDKACPFKPVDITFVLDGSGSEGHANFNKQLQFVSNITKQFEIGENNTRVSLVTFSTKAHNEFFLNQYYNKAKLLSHIANVAYPNGETNTHSAIHFVSHHTLSPNHGAERNVTKLVIVLTDGQSSHPALLQHAISNLKNNPLVTTIAVGIGKAVDPIELRMIASDSNNTFQVSSFDALHTIQNELTGTACKACNKMVSNVCFVLDSSGSEGAINFHKQLEFVNMVVNEFSFGHGAKTHVCLITFASGAFHEIHLRQYHDKNSIMTNVLKVPWRNGETMTDKGLTAAKQELSHSHGNKVAIVLTDGKSSNPALTKQAANSLHRLGIETFAVGIGRHVNNDELEVIASNNRHVFTVGTFDQLAHIHQRVVNRICANARRQHTQTTATAATKRPHTTRKYATKLPTTARTTTTTTTTTPLPPTTPKPACSLKPADIVFVVDSSENQGVDNVKTAADFVYDFATKFSTDSNNVQFSVVTFSSDVRNGFFFNKYNSRQSVLHAIRNIQYMGHGTNTSGALNFVRTQSLLPANGARTNASKFVIVVTNGRSDNQVQTKHEAQLLQKQAEVISVGIEPVDDQAELANIASNHLVVTGNSDALIKIIKTRLTDPVCALR